MVFQFLLSGEVLHGGFASPLVNHAIIINIEKPAPNKYGFEQMGQIIPRNEQNLDVENATISMDTLTSTTLSDSSVPNKST